MLNHPREKPITRYCARHHSLELTHVCIDPHCQRDGILCSECIAKDHNAHSRALIEDFYRMLDMKVSQPNKELLGFKNREKANQLASQLKQLTEALSVIHENISRLTQSLQENDLEGATRMVQHLQEVFKDGNSSQIQVEFKKALEYYLEIEGQLGVQSLMSNENRLAIRNKQIERIKVAIKEVKQSTSSMVQDIGLLQNPRPQSPKNPLQTSSKVIIDKKVKKKVAPQAVVHQQPRVLLASKSAQRFPTEGRQLLRHHTQLPKNNLRHKFIDVNQSLEIRSLDCQRGYHAVCCLHQVLFAPKHNHYMNGPDQVWVFQIRSLKGSILFGVTESRRMFQCQYKIRESNLAFHKIIYVNQRGGVYHYGGTDIKQLNFKLIEGDYLEIRACCGNGQVWFTRYSYNSGETQTLCYIQLGKLGMGFLPFVALLTTQDVVRLVNADEKILPKDITLSPIQPLI